MVNLFIFIILIIAMIAIGCFFASKIKGIFYKITIFISDFVVFIPFFLFYADYYNIPTFLGYTSKLDSNRWFSFLGDYFGILSSCVLTGIIMLWITKYQLSNENKSKEEEKRIANQPIFKYDILNGYPTNPLSHKFFCKGTGSNTHRVIYSIQNIGNNHAKNVKVEYKYKTQTIEWPLGVENQSFISSDKAVAISLIIDKAPISMSDFIMVIKYEDMLNNRYEQTITLCVSNTSSGTNISNIKVSEIVLIK